MEVRTLEYSTGTLTPLEPIRALKRNPKPLFVFIIIIITITFFFFFS